MAVRAFGASVFFPHHRRGDPIDLSNEAVYLENTRVIADNIFEALDLLDTPRQAALLHQCLQDALKAPGRRSSEARFLQRYITQEGLEIGPGNYQSLRSFIIILKLYQDIVRVLGILVEVHNVKAHWSELLQAARSHAVSNAQAEIALSVRDLVEVYQEYQIKFKDFADSNLAMRNVCTPFE